ncbi:uncharacterized protein [Watersipora subatra]|uniref:uncharacterized protein n=1 Tax=Watersipora subatra TaxID=2589382 RepID=UPI00355BE4B7
MQCSLLVTAAQFSYAVLYNDKCYGTNDDAIFLQGPAAVNCSAERTGSADTIDVYFFPGITYDQLNDSLSCVSGANLNANGLEGFCGSYESPVLTYRSRALDGVAIRVRRRTVFYTKTKV